MNGTNDRPRVNLSLLPQHLDYIANLLLRAPYGEVAPIFTDIQQQLQQQGQQAQQAPQSPVLHAVQP